MTVIVLVPEPLLDQLRVSTELDEQGGARVAKVMHPQALWKPRRCDGRLEDALVQVVPPQQASLRGGEYVVVRRQEPGAGATSGGEHVSDLLAERARHPDGAPYPILDRPNAPSGASSGQWRGS